MTPTEICWGYLVGFDDSTPEREEAAGSPRPALEEAVRVGLERPPCGVAFSGGRDSSLVLAVATHVARRDGLPDPIPITRRFPDVDATDETEWQELVIRRTGLDDWVRIDLHDELDVLGPLARQHLVEHGVVWPPSIAGDRVLTQVVKGGALLDGEGGDEVLGVEAHRIAPINRLVRRPRPLRRWKIRQALGAAAPARLRVPRVRRRRLRSGPAWLRPAAWAGFMDALDEVEAAQPLSFAHSVRMVPRRRTQVLLAHNRRIQAKADDVAVISPLLDPRVVAALAADGGFLGRGDRTALLQLLGDGLLPDSIMSRTSKANFTVAYVGRPTREFARGWSGEGVDPDLVDPEALRSMWLSDHPPAPTSALLQAAWIAAEAGDSVERAGERR